MAEDVEGSLCCYLLAACCACRREFQMSKLKSKPDFSRSSAGGNGQNVVQVVTLGRCLRLRQTIEVLAQGFAGQKDGRNAQVAVLNQGGNEVKSSSVQLG